jgi:hypothetical protein
MRPPKTGLSIAAAVTALIISALAAVQAVNVSAGSLGGLLAL